MEGPGVTYRFHRHVQAAYSSVYTWLETQRILNYRTIDFAGIKRSLYGDTLEDCANVYHGFFPAHHFKVLHTLEKVVGYDRILGWLRHNPHICIVDIGCGAGAGSSAVIGTILRLRDEGLLTQPMEVLCVGVDPNRKALALYAQLLSHLQSRLVDEGITLRHKVHPYAIPNAIFPVIHTLKEVREGLVQPFLPHVLAMQVNIVSPLSADHDQRTALRNELQSLGVGVEAFIDQQVEFGEAEALAYRQFFEQVPIDNIHLLTVATDNDPCPQLLDQMGSVLDRTFGAAHHQVDEIGRGSHVVRFENPAGSFFYRCGYQARPVTFHVHFASVTNKSLTQDNQWQALMDDDNLKLAWAQARRHLLSESIADEVEIRIFDTNLEHNLRRLKEQLPAYARGIVPSAGRFSYGFPKKEAIRPRGLSTFEEAILSAAILLQLGHRADRLKGESYAYSLSTGRRPTEYLYEPWFLAYQRYVSKAQKVALEYGRCVIRQVDIKSFFERIVQSRLLELASQELRTTSPRIEWLLRLLLEKEIDSHEAGRGLVQGNLDSGFYANIYLTDVGARFARPNEWDVTMLRYVDDMILIGSNLKAIDDATDALREELEKLGLELNEKKTETHTDASTFILATTDDLLGELSTESKAVFNPIWIMDDNYREVFLAASAQQDPLWWWYWLGLYQKCLREIGIFEDLKNLSRKVDSYLRNVSRRRRDLTRDTELTFPQLPQREDPEILAHWGLQFARENAEWVADRTGLRDRAAQLVRESWSELKLSQDSGNGERKSLRRIHFGMNKLIQLGCEDTSPLITEILCNDPWLVRDPSWVVEGLAVQGLSHELETILDFNANRNDATAEFVRAVTIRGLQFLSNITTSQWRKIVRYATSGSTVERLLATETWLQLGDTCDGMVNEGDVSTLKKMIIESPGQNSRLRKNYILLLGRYDASALPPVHADDDDIVRDAYDLIARGTASDLFDEPEPDLIRKSYYSGRAQDDRLSGPSL